MTEIGLSVVIGYGSNRIIDVQKTKELIAPKKLALS